jgi:uncharacterized membrane-anchored protein
MSSLKELIQKCIKAEMPTIDIGVVTVEEPLRVTLEDDAKINLSTTSLIIPSGKTPLKQGEKVYLLSLNRNKIYYVLDRV